MMAQFPIAAIPFTNGWMLLWATAAIAPWIIHLWNRQRYQVTNWAANHLLAAAVKRAAKRVQLQDLLLLLIRTCILLLFALAIAEPLLGWIPLLGGGEPKSGHTHHVLVIDSSYSMQFQEESETRFAVAKQRAIELIRNSEQGDGFSLVTLSDPPQVIVSDPCFDPADIITEIGRLKAAQSGAKLTATLSEVKQLIQTANEKHPRLRDSSVTFITDLGTNTWEAAQNGSSRNLFDWINQAGQSRLIDLGGSQSSNAWIEEFRISQPVVSVEQPISCEIEIRHNGQLAVGQLPLEVIIGTEVVFRNIVEIQDHKKSQTVTFSHTFDQPGEVRLHARLGDDPLSLDNSRWLCLSVRESIRVLCVRGKPRADRYVRIALQATTSRGPKVSVKVEDESILSDARLSDYDCLFLCNIGRFNQHEARRLSQFLSSGGSIVFFLGDQVQAEAYNRVLAEHKPRILPVRIGKPSQLGEYYFNTLEFRHPILAPFSQTGRNLLAAIPTWKYHRCTAFESSSQIAVEFSSGDPAIVEERIGRGRVVVFATDGSLSSVTVSQSSGTQTPWSALALYQGFPPLVRETLHLALDQQRNLKNVRIGQTIGGSLAIGRANSAMISGPKLASDEVRLQLKEDQASWTYLPKSVGIFQRKYGKLPNQLFAVNLDSTTESTMQRVSAKDIKPLFAITGTNEQVAGRVDAIDRLGPPIYRYCLGLVLVLLCLESTLAWRFGKRD